MQKYTNPSEIADHIGSETLDVVSNLSTWIGQSHGIVTSLNLTRLLLNIGTHPRGFSSCMCYVGGLTTVLDWEQWLMSPHAPCWHVIAINLHLNWVDKNGHRHYVQMTTLKVILHICSCCFYSSRTVMQSLLKNHFSNQRLFIQWNTLLIFKWIFTTAIVQIWYM